ncbi:MAG: hypothetical protein HYZ81_20665 [Nitrospinae bacterium]|nr:hypothetical protein [Nitrospinota bacterium]
MTANYTVFVGTTGQGIWRSRDGGETWMRLRPALYAETEVRALAAHPTNPKLVYAGTEIGLYASADGGETWRESESPMRGREIWSLAISAADPPTIFAGTRPSAVFRSRDGGHYWEQLSVPLAEECPAVGIPRVTALLLDPVDPATVWLGVEVDGVRRSRDAGDTWEVIKDGLANPDIHGMAVSAGPSKAVFTATNNEIYKSEDDGKSWQPLRVKDKFPWVYCRGMAVKPDDPQVIFVGNGDAAAGSTGALQRSTDGGKTWTPRPLSEGPNSTMWCVATHPADASLMFASSIFGEVYRSRDGGESWQKLPREFSEIRALLWVPA